MSEMNDEELVRAMIQVAEAITPNVAPGRGASGGVVGSLTEAVVDVAGASVRIASAIDRLAEAVEDHG